MLERFDSNEPHRRCHEARETRYHEERPKRKESRGQECESYEKKKESPSLLTICAHQIPSPEVTASGWLIIRQSIHSRAMCNRDATMKSTKDQFLESQDGARRN